jgi:uncharacterized protein
MRNKSSLSPLHRAVIEGNLADVEKLSKNTEWIDQQDSLGFTPVELAYLLGKKECQALMEKKNPPFFKVQGKGQQVTESLSLENFEKYFGIIYRPVLFFSSYSLLQDVINNCPYLMRSSWLINANMPMNAEYLTELQAGSSVALSIKWIDEVLQWGVFADQDIAVGSLIGEYTGVVRRLFRHHPDQNAYCLRYPTRWWSLKYYIVDALHEGNIMRFVNHSRRPNLEPACLVDRRLLRQVLIASETISAGTQLTFNYGEDYWIRRKQKDAG